MYKFLIIFNILLKIWFDIVYLNKLKWVLYEGSLLLSIKSILFICIGVFDLLYKYVIDNLKKIRIRFKY